MLPTLQFSSQLYNDSIIYDRYLEFPVISTMFTFLHSANEKKVDLRCKKWEFISSLWETLAISVPAAHIKAFMNSIEDVWMVDLLV